MVPAAVMSGRNRAVAPGGKTIVACDTGGGKRKGHDVVDEQPHVSVEQGDGLVARFGDCVVLVGQADSPEAGVEEILQAVEASAAEAGSPGPAIATRLAAIVAACDERPVPPFGVVAPLEDTIVVFLHGPVWADITGTEGSQRISGLQAVTWVDHIVRAPFQLLSVGSGERPIQADPRSDLRAGRVPGSGFVLTPAGSGGERPAEPDGGPPTMASPEARPTQAPASAPEELPAASSAPAPEPAPTPEPTPAPEPAAAPATAPPVGTGARATIVPAADTAAHASEPEQELEPEPAPAVPVAETAPQPGGDAADKGAVPANATVFVTRPVGFLVAADGMRIPLDRGYVLGREPEIDPAVADGEATPVRLSDEGNLISRVQSHIAVHHGEVQVRDAGSLNGTFVAGPGDEEWTRIGTDAVALPPEWSLRVGDVVFTYVVTAAS